MYLLKIFLSFLTVISLITSNLYAEDVIYLKKDDKAPYDGFLFTPEKANDTRIKLIESDFNRNLNESYEKTLKLYQSNEEILNNKVNILLTQNDKLAESLYEARETSGWVKFAYFGLGVLATGFAFYVGTEIIKSNRY